MSFENLPRIVAQEKTEKVKWHVEGTAGGSAILTTPEGMQYELNSTEQLVLDEDPTGTVEAFIFVGAERVSFADWIETK